MVQVSLALVDALLSRKSSATAALERVATHVPCEVAIGANGRVCIDAVTPARTALVAQVLLNAEHLNAAQMNTMVNALLAKAQQEGVFDKT